MAWHVSNKLMEAQHGAGQINNEVYRGIRGVFPEIQAAVTGPICEDTDMGTCTWEKVLVGPRFGIRMGWSGTRQGEWYCSN